MILNCHEQDLIRLKVAQVPSVPHRNQKKELETDTKFWDQY